MKINKLYISSFLSVSMFLACGGTDQTATKEVAEEMVEEVTTTSADINIEASSVLWKGSMMGMYSHEGTIEIQSGSVELSNDHITGGTVVVDMTTINPTDDNYDPEKESTPEKLVGHLSSPDFFDIENNPTATFEITGSDANTITGNLTVRGVTNQEVVENVSHDHATQSWSGTLTFDRKKYDVAFDMPMEDMVLSDDIELKINIVL